MKKLAFPLFPLLALTVGSLSASLSRAGLEGMYPLLIKSPLTPPDAVFPIVWTVLYVLMGLGLALVVRSCVRADRAHPARWSPGAFSWR